MAYSVDITAPHLNAEVYRRDTNVSNVLSYFDYIHIHSDGTVLIGCSELTGRYWNGGARTLKSLKENKDTASKVTISLSTGTADGCFIHNSDKILLCEDNGTVSLWCLADNSWKQWEELLSVTEHDDSVLGVDCIDPINFYVTVAADGNIKIWDINEMICETNYRNAHSRMITGVMVKPDTTNFVTCSLDRYVSLWNKNLNGKVQDIIQLECGARCVQWLDDNYILIGDESGCMNLLDVRNPKNLEKVANFPASVHRIAVQSESNKVAVCCDNKTVSVFNVNDNKTLTNIYKNSDKHNNYVRGLAWDNIESNTLHSSGWDGTVKTHVIVD